MKTNVVMQSADRNLFGIIIKQNTKNGQSLSVSDLMKAYEKARYQYGGEEKNIHEIVNNKGFKETIYITLNSIGVVKLHIDDFLKEVEDKGLIKVLKSIGMWETYGRGDNKEVFCNSYIWTLLALELHPIFFTELVSNADFSVLNIDFDTQVMLSKKEIMKTYLFQSGDKYKIGKSRDINRRLEELGLYNPDIKLVCEMVGDLETELHKKYKKYLYKREWFIFDNETLKSVLKDFKQTTSKSNH